MTTHRSEIRPVSHLSSSIKPRGSFVAFAFRNVTVIYMMIMRIHTSLKSGIQHCHFERCILSVFHKSDRISSYKHLCNAIRPATIEDIPSLISIEEACYNWNSNQIAEELHRERAVVLVHQPDKQTNTDQQTSIHVTGWIVAWHVPPDELQILQIAVHPHHRRKGIATLLLRSLIHDTTMNTSVVLLEVRASNHAAIHLYEKEGFEIVGSRPRFYNDGEDAILMNKYLL